MKHIIHNFYLKQFVPLSILFTASLVIWFAGPWISFVPLQEPEKRFYIIILLFLAWFLKLIFLNSNETTPEIAEAPEHFKKLKTLEGRFLGALQFLKKTIINKNGKNICLSQLPWYLLIGPTETGKTSLLAHANVNYILSKQFKTEQLTHLRSSDSCDWWVTRDAVLVDVPGNYLASREKKNISLDNFLWNHLLKFIKKHRYNEGINGIIVAIPLAEIYKQQILQKKPLMNAIKFRISQVQEKFGYHLPINLVVTKCDGLPGFIEFFSESSGDELTQAWGVTLPLLKENEKLSDVFTTRFNALIQRLNKQLLWRLHQERNPHARVVIKDFPLQMENLKDAMVNFLKALMIPDLRLTGVYLTSALQTQNEDPSKPQTINASTQALQIMQHPNMPTRTHFIKQFILQGILHNQELYVPIPKKVKWQRHATYAIATVTVLIAAILLGHDFQKSVQQAYSIQNDLSQYQLYLQQTHSGENHLTKALPLLNALQKAADFSNNKLSRIGNILTFYSEKSQKTATIVYAQALQKIILPEVKNTFEHYLQSPTDKNPAHLYSVLKAYLMLGDYKNLNVNYVASILNQLSPSLSRQESAELISHIFKAFSTGASPLKLNSDLITQVRKQLINLPSAELGLIILKNTDKNNANNELNLGVNMGEAPVFISKQASLQIPTMYTIKAFQPIVTREIIGAATEALQGNAILGNITTMPEPTMIAALTNQIRNRYIAKYVEAWENVLANIQLYTPKNLAQTATMVENLTSTTSPLMLLLQSIQQNTDFAPVITASSKLQMLNSMLSNAGGSTQSAVSQIFDCLRQLHVYLQNIVHASNIDQAAFQAAASHMQNPTADPIFQLHNIAEQSPEPLKSWLNSIAQESWNFIFQNAQNHIATTWQTTIISTYKSQFADRFPFASNETKEVDIKQFSQFFGPQGTLATFFKNDLKPFINDSGSEWQWRTVDNQRLSFSSDIFDQMQSLEKLQHAFFPNGDNKLFVQFTLEPTSIDSSMKSFDLNINGQHANYPKSSHEPRTLAWPGTSNVHKTSLNFITNSDQLIGAETKGDWALFRIINRAASSVMSKKQMSVNFNVNGHTAKFTLFTQGNVNPFASSVLQDLELPENLTDKN